MDVIGGGILVAVAAALWIAYLLPSWLATPAVPRDRAQRGATAADPAHPRRDRRDPRAGAHRGDGPRGRVAAAHPARAPAGRAARRRGRRAARDRRAARGRGRGRAAARSRAARAPMAAHAPHRSHRASSGRRIGRRSPRRRRMPPARRGARCAGAGAACSLPCSLALLTVVGGLIAAAFGATRSCSRPGELAVAAFAGIVALARVRVAPSAPAAVPAEVVPEVFEPIELPETEADERRVDAAAAAAPLHLSRGTIAAMAMASIEAAAELKRASRRGRGRASGRGARARCADSPPGIRAGAARIRPPRASPPALRAHGNRRDARPASTTSTRCCAVVAGRLTAFRGSATRSMVRTTPRGMIGSFSLGPMAQLVARLVRNEKVGGSNPPGSTKSSSSEPPTC